ncbi:hypothetical protein Deipr_2329 (plasmid) [Deinococcus proteolyticus MRP]|uniref:Uncharacterized protein n=2 Tax=Deinococcus proteolyticus TaxID=55148 RepID=F0RQ95_DEIPM|nr:hypothetical protein Deipr_2329 [Deinococcus proteolyticus MRP]
MSIVQMTERLNASVRTLQQQPSDVSRQAAELVRRAVPDIAGAPSEAAARRQLEQTADQLYRHYAAADTLAADHLKAAL